MGNGSQPVQMTDAQLHAVVKETVEQVFLEMGIRVDSPSVITSHSADTDTTGCVGGDHSGGATLGDQLGILRTPTKAI